MKSLSPTAQREKKWAETARGMEVAKYASTMKKNRLANEKAEVDLAKEKARSEAMAGYDKGLSVQTKVEEFLATPNLDEMPPADRMAHLMKTAAELSDQDAQQAFIQAAEAGDYQTGDRNLGAMAEKITRTFGTEIKRGEKGWYINPRGEVEMLRKDSPLATQPAADWQVELHQQGTGAQAGYGGPEEDIQVVDGGYVAKSGPNKGKWVAMEGYKKPPEELTAQEKEIKEITEQLVATGMSLGDANNRASNIAQGNISVKIGPTGRVIETNNITGEATEIPVSNPKQAAPARNTRKRTLFESADDATGMQAGAKAAGNIASSTLGGPIDPDVERARQSYKDETQHFIRAMAISDKFSVLEQEQIRKNLSLEPGMFTSPDRMREKIISVSDDLTDRAVKAEHDAGNVDLPADLRKKQAQNARMIRNFLPTLGAPKPIPSTVEGIAAMDMEDFAMTIQYMTDDQAERLRASDPDLFKAIIQKGRGQ